jgi:hypothetical protein
MKLFITSFVSILIIASIFIGASYYQTAETTINVESAIQSHKALKFNHIAADSSVIKDEYTIILFSSKVIMDGDTYNGSWKQDTFVEKNNAFSLLIKNQQIEVHWPEPEPTVWYFYNN